MVVLVGLMGAGKTTIGRQLATRLGWPFADSDHEVERRTGVKIPLIFDIEGEEGFRKRETQVLTELVQSSKLVLATGGGVVLAQENRDAIKKYAGLVVYLRVSPELLFARTRHDKNRPLLRVPDPLLKIRTLWTERDPLYQEVSDVVLDGDKLSAKQIATVVESEIVKRCEPLS